MSATLFYDSLFKTGYPFSKLYVYYNNTSDLAVIYDSEFNPVSNPLVMDSYGNSFLFIDEDKEYRYELFDENDNLIYIEENIQQLKGTPGTPGGPVGPVGDIGETGFQGISGGQGPVGEDGLDGDKGLPYYSSIYCEDSMTVNIPAGVSGIYLTGCAGGGAGASWSSYALVSKYYNYDRAPYQIARNVFRRRDEILVTPENKEIFYYVKYQSLVYMPGSGFAGKSTFRQFVSLDPSKSNQITVEIGYAGQPDTITLNGGSGGDTKVYVNDTLALNLKGGIGGQNIFPNNEEDVSAALTRFKFDGTTTAMNTGYSGGMILFQNRDTDNNKYVPTFGVSDLFWDSFYQSNNTIGIQTVDFGYMVPISYVPVSSLRTISFSTSSVEDVKGAENIFGTVYSQKPNYANWSSRLRINNSVKSNTKTSGFGAGGDVYLYFNNRYTGAVVKEQIFDNMFYSLTNKTNFIDYNRNEYQDIIIRFMREFTISDTRKPGLLSIPEKGENMFWETMDAVETSIKTDPSNIIFENTGFYKIMDTMGVTTEGIDYLTPKGCSGVKGFVKIEFGDIKEHKPE